MGNEIVDLVPGEPFITGDVEVLADGGAVTEESVEAFGKVGVVGECPEGCSISGNADGLALEHPIEDGVAAIEGEKSLVISVGRADDGDGEFLFAVGAGEAFFAGNFVSGVFPKRVVQGGGFSDREVVGRGLISRCAGDEDVLAGFSSEEGEVAFDLIGGVDDPVDDGIPGVVF